MKSVDASENYADVFTKTLSAKQMQYLMAPFFCLPVGRGIYGEIRTTKVYRHDQRCEAAGHIDVGACKSLACTCKGKLLMATILAMQ